MMRAAAVLACLLALLCSPAHAETKKYNAPEGNVSSLIVLEAGGFARVYGMFTKGVARISYDDQTKVMDNLKVAFLANTFVTSSPTLRSDMFGSQPFRGNMENEVAFVQNEATRLDSPGAQVKGDLVVNGIRKPVTMDVTLNKFGRINQNTDMESDGAMTLGLSLHATFKRSDFGMSLTKQNSPFNDEAVFMIDIVGLQ